MGQILSWIRGPRDTPGLQDVSVEEQSHSSQTTPKPAAQVTTVKPAEFEVESSATMATKPGVTSTKGGLAASASVGGKGRETTKAQTEVKASALSSASAGKTAAAASSTKPGDRTKVQVEVPSAASKEAKKAASDPFDALSSLLPEATTPAAPETIATGLEVTEHYVTAETHEKCGERDETLPPGYRFQDMPPAPADYKPKDVPKPLSTDEALDSLSIGFLSSSTPSTKMQKRVETVSPSSAASNFAPPPSKKADSSAPPADKKAKLDKAENLAAGISATPFRKGGSPQADKKAKMVTKVVAKKDADSNVPLDALGALGDMLPTAQPKPELPPPKDIVAEAKHKKEKGVRTGENDNTIHPDYRFNKEELEKYPAPKPEPTINTDDALDFLSGGFTSVPSVPVAPAVSTCQVDGIIIEKVEPKKKTKVSCTIDETLVANVGPKTKAAAVPTCQVDGISIEKVEPKKKKEILQQKVEDSTALDLLSQSFGAPTNSQPSLPRAPQPTVCPIQEPVNIDFKMPAKEQTGSSMLGDAFSELGDLLPPALPVQEPPKIRPEDIVSEGKVVEEEGVRVGEDDETLPPDYRFSEEDLKKRPAAKPQPTMNTTDALDILSGDFMTSSKAPAVQAPMVRPSAPPAQASADVALDSLTRELAACSATPSVRCELPVPVKITPDLESGADVLDALDTLSDTLKDINSRGPIHVEIPTRDLVNEKKVEEERLIKMGERDDTLPPEFRPTEEDLKEMKKMETDVKPKQTLSTEGALDLLSSDFSTVTSTEERCQEKVAAAAEQVLESEPKKQMPGPVLKAMSETLLPEDMAAKYKADKPKGKSKSKSKSKKHPAEDELATDLLSAQLTTDVVSKGGVKK